MSKKTEPAAQTVAFPGARKETVRAHALIRSDGMWRLVYLDIPAEDVPLYETKRTDPDLLAMQVSRVEHELNRAPEWYR